MLGDSVGTTSRISMVPVWNSRARMSLLLLATQNRSIGRPMLRADHPANTLPKLPVGTVNETGVDTDATRDEATT